MYEDIKEQFSKVVKYSQGYDKDAELKGIDSLFEKWAEAKAHFINAFGGELIYELPNRVSWEMPEEMKYDEIAEFKVWLKARYGEEGRNLALYINLLSADEFYNNLLSDDINVPSNDRKECYEFKAGTKVLRTFKNFITNPKNLEDIQNKASRIIQENKLSGTMCFSVHPLDYLSISETTHNWRSCHALNGEYRAGNVSYMIDSSTFMCYLKSDKEEKLPSFPSDVPWNSKKWRVLLFLSQNRDILTAGRQYPFGNKNYLEMIFPALAGRGLFTSNCNFGSFVDSWDTRWRTHIIDSVEERGESENRIPAYQYLNLAGTILRSGNIFKVQKDSLNYNDLLHSSCYTPLSICSKMVHPTSKMVIGGKNDCLCCGNAAIRRSDMFVCGDCHDALSTASENKRTCLCCDRPLDLLEDGYVIEHSTGDIVCAECGDRFLTQCSRCGELFYNESIRWDEGIAKCQLCYNRDHGPQVTLRVEGPTFGDSEVLQEALRTSQQEILEAAQEELLRAFRLPF